MSIKYQSIYNAVDQQARLAGRDIAEFEPHELLEMLFIIYVQYNNSFDGQFNDWKDHILADRAEALEDKQDSFVQDLDPDER